MAEANAFVWSLQSSVNNINISTRGAVRVPSEMSSVIQQVQGILPNQARIHVEDEDQGVSTVVNLDNIQEDPAEIDNQNNENGEAQAQADGDTSPPPVNRNNGTDRDAARILRQFAEGRWPLHLAFLLILLARMIYEHILGIAVFVALYGTFCQANSTVKKLTAKRNPTLVCNRALLKCIWILAFPIINVSLIYYVFEDQKLFRLLIFRLPEIGLVNLDLFTLLWIVSIGDLIVKYITIDLKALVLFMPQSIIHRRNRGQFFTCIEELSQLYRTVLPIVPWISYIMDAEHSGYIFSIFLMIVYTLIKAYSGYRVLYSAKQTLHRAFMMTNFLSRPSHDDLVLAGEMCAICHDSFTNPVKLKCGHIFCDDCLTIWLDREQTCPMCRNNVVDKPVWRDGSTDTCIQWY